MKVLFLFLTPPPLLLLLLLLVVVVVVVVVVVSVKGKVYPRTSDKGPEWE
jgi:hypothetical protein